MAQVLGPCTYVGDSGKALSSRLLSGPALVVVVPWGDFFLSQSNSAFQTSNLHIYVCMYVCVYIFVEI